MSFNGFFVDVVVVVVVIVFFFRCGLEPLVVSWLAPPNSYNVSFDYNENMFFTATSISGVELFGPVILQYFVVVLFGREQTKY